MHTIDILDSHTGGEPTRLVLSGFPDLGSGTIAERRARLQAEFDTYRRAVMLEPRGHEVLVGALLCSPADPANTCGVIFFNNAGYLGMCGHGTIGVIASLAHLGRISEGEHRVETPVGTVCATLHADGSVSVENVRAYRHAQAVPLTLSDGRIIHGDIAWGGNWFFLVNDHGERVSPDNIPRLMELSSEILHKLHVQGIRGAGGEIDHIELFAKTPEADSRSFVLCPGRQYDRSPCGTGTSAKLACLAADGMLAPEQTWLQESVIGSQFRAYYRPHPEGGIIPTIRGTAYISARTQILLDLADPFCWGIPATACGEI